MTKTIRFLSIAVLVAGAAAAQDAPEVKANTWEIGTFAGSSFGLDNFRVMAGANAGYAVTKVLFPYAEVSYLPGIARRETFGRTQVNYELPMTDFHAGLHLRAPIPGKRFVPYGIIGFGLIRIGSGVGKSTTDGVPGNDISISSSTEFATNFGGGARVYVTERWGFRVEAKAYKPTGRFTDIFGRVAGGLFWQF